MEVMAVPQRAGALHPTAQALEQLVRRQDGVHPMSRLQVDGRYEKGICELVAIKDNP